MAILWNCLRWLVVKIVFSSGGKISIGAALASVMSWLFSAAKNVALVSISSTGLIVVTDYVLAHTALTSLPLPANIINALSAMGVTSGLSIIATAVDLKVSTSIGRSFLAPKGTVPSSVAWGQ